MRKGHLVKLKKIKIEKMHLVRGVLVHCVPNSWQHLHLELALHLANLSKISILYNDLIILY